MARREPIYFLILTFTFLLGMICGGARSQIKCPGQCVAPCNTCLLSAVPHAVTQTVVANNTPQNTALYTGWPRAPAE